MSLKLLILLQLCNVLFLNCAGYLECPLGTFPSDIDATLCYKFVETGDAFDQAEYSCQQEGGHLAQIKDKNANLFVSDLARKNLNATPLYWIGGKHVEIKTKSSYLWTWTDDTLIKYFNWIQGSDALHSDRNCIGVQSADAGWSALNCSRNLPYVCQMQKKTSICGEGWTFNGKINKCFKVFTDEGINFDNAEAKCVAATGHLVSIHNYQEHVVVAGLAKTDPLANGEAWIGARTDANLTYHFVDGTPFDFHYWRPGYSVAFLNHCVYIHAEQSSSDIVRWIAYPCDSTLHRFICQRTPQVDNKG